MSTLVLELESGGCRHYVDGSPVHCGTQLQMQLGGQWINVRYEASLGSDPENVRVMLYAIGGRIIPESDALFRWPGGAQ